MRRGVVGVLAAVLVASGAGQVPAGAAEDWAPPVLTSPAPDALLVGTAELTATSESPYVVFELVNSQNVVRRTPVAAGEDGVFRDTLPTVGLYARFTAQVRACSAASVESCTTASEPIPVRSGSAPKLSSAGSWPASSVIDPTVYRKVTLRADGLEGFPATVSGATPSREVGDGDLIEVDLSSLPNRTLLVSLRQCNPLNTRVCRMTERVLTVRNAPDMEIWGAQMFVSPNGDGFSETTSTRVTLDRHVAITARWRIRSSSGATVAGPYELTGAEIAEGQRDEVTVVIDPRARWKRALPSGEYRFEIEATGNVTGFTKSARRSAPLFVSGAPPITKLTPSVRVFYPYFSSLGSRSGVPTELRVSPALDPYEAKYDYLQYRILASSGQPLGGTTQLYGVGSALAWDGSYVQDGSVRWARGGTYRIELVRTRSCEQGVCEKVYGPVSAPFTLRDKDPALVHPSAAFSARSTWQRTAVKRNARVQRGKHGVLRFSRKSARRGTGRVTTVHSVRIPTQRTRDPGHTFHARLRGDWGSPDDWGSPGDVKIAVITPQGRTLPYRAFTRTRRSVVFALNEKWVNADGRVRIKVRWKGTKPARLDRFVISYSKYDLTP